MRSDGWSLSFLSSYLPTSFVAFSVFWFKTFGFTLRKFAALKLLVCLKQEDIAIKSPRNKSVCVYIYIVPSLYLCYLQCFAVRSLGWVEMAEEDLAPGKSSVAVNNCIRQLSYCKNDIRDTVGIWGEVRRRVLSCSMWGGLGFVLGVKYIFVVVGSKGSGEEECLYRLRTMNKNLGWSKEQSNRS